MTVRVVEIEFFRLDMQTRFPFRYGIAKLTGLQHLIVRMSVQVSGKTVHGYSADGLTPKWFTKNPNTIFEDDDLPEMLRVIGHAANLAKTSDEMPSVFRWWLELYRNQHAWASGQSVPPLLAGFGVSLMERAMIDAVCRATGVNFFEAVRNNLFEIEFSKIAPSLGHLQPADVLPNRPKSAVSLRHTIGLSDPLTDNEITAADRAEDGLPQSLESCIEKYGLDHFKVKLSGNMDADVERMTRLAKMFAGQPGRPIQFTLDGNEQYQTISDFREVWEVLRSDASARRLIDQSLLFVEQPLHRDVALNEMVKG